MKRYINTIFISSQGSYLSKDGECVKIAVEGREDARVPVHTIGGIVCFGNVTCSPFLLGHCAECGVAVSFHTENGRFLAAVRGFTEGNVLLRREQYRLADLADRSALAARCFVAGKLANCRTILRRSAREKGDDGLSVAADAIDRRLGELPGAGTVDMARGVEGEAAAIYFGAFDRLVGGDREEFRFSGRSRRPPLDPINCLLSFLYMVLMHDVRGALESVGLDPAVGFLHRDRPGRPSLALDVMEEFRPYLADRLALTLVNRGQLSGKDFQIKPGGGVIMKEDARKTVLTAWQERKRETVRHPYLDEEMEVGLLWHIQARLLAKFVRGELDAYPPFVAR